MSSGEPVPGSSKTAFVLGGGGRLGACEVGMLRALFERGVVPELIVGTSIGALNGAAVAAAPTAGTIDRLEAIWTSLDKSEVFSGTVFSGAANLLRTRTSLQSNEPLRTLVERLLPAKTFADLAVPFQCVAASIERASEHWFFEGPLVDAILASCAVPGILPPVKIEDEHFIDGGVVNSIPIARAVELGATEIFVLHVGRIERPLAAPRNPWQVAMVAFEVARRHRFARDMASLPSGVVAHVLPAGETAPRFDSFEQLRYKNFGSIVRHVEAAYEATAAYLDEGALARGTPRS
ncbi:MAG TPA: patatin-like phospholipase family protein [Actinomycetota bacterium]|nr:patatin-like phospholipase family protein [Actinomycetota bacterium]